MIERPFQGVISGLVFGGNRILDMGAEDDPRVSVQGDVELLITIPPGGQTAVPTADSEEVNANAIYITICILIQCFNLGSFNICFIAEINYSY